MRKIYINIRFNYPSLKFIFNLYFFTTALSLFSIQLFAQMDTINVQGDISPSEGNLNRAIEAAIDSGSLSNTVFELEPYGYYILTDSIVVPRGEALTITASKPGNMQETAPPQIIWTSKTEVNKKYNFKVFGDLTLKNIWLMYASTDGWQAGSAISFIGDSVNIGKQYGNFEGVIFDYSRQPANASGAVCIETNKFLGIFKNCYWKNCTDSHFRYYGRAVSFPYNTKGYHIDSLTFENCTFANIGYVYSQEGEYQKGQYADYLKFNHCTFLNVVMYPLESGWWNKLSVSNCLFVNTFMFGDIPAASSFGSGEPYGGTLRIDSVSSFGFSVPFTDQERRILFTNSSYYIEKWLSDWMFSNPMSRDLRSWGRVDQIPEPQPMLSPKTLRFFDSGKNGSKLFSHMNRANLLDSRNPNFILPPTDSNGIKGFLYHKWFDSSDSSWAWKSQNSFNRLWPLEENLAYTNRELKTGGMGGFPLGDLYRWWPEEYAQWKTQERGENSRISYWLNTGRDSVFTGIEAEKNIVHKFELLQNYPNPFNPTTNFELRITDYGFVSLKVYDILGRVAAVLVNEEKDAGKYKVFWNAEGLSSGVYFYRLVSGGFVQTKKLLLLK